MYNHRKRDRKERWREIEGERDRERQGDCTHILHFFITLLHLSSNKSANFLVLSVYFTEDNYGEKDD